MPRMTETQSRWPRWFFFAVLALVALARLRLLDFPLERDEGEYAYAGQLILQGFPPYELAYNMKFPGTYLAYAAIMAVFGQTPAGIHLGLLLLTTGTALMLFWLGKKILDETAGIAAATSYAVLAASPTMLGTVGHATHFCAFFATAGLCFLWLARQKQNLPALAASGIFFGTAVLMKQHAAIIAAWAGLHFAFVKFFCANEKFSQRLALVAIYAVAMLAPLGLVCLWLWHAGVFAEFKFWTIDYAREYASAVPLAYAPQLFWTSFHKVISIGGLLWLVAATGLFVIWRDERWKNSRTWLLGFVVASAAAVCPDFYFRKHYFLIALPALALLVGAAVSGLQQWLNEKNQNGQLAFWNYAAIVGITIFTAANIWFVLPIPQIIRGSSPADHGMYGADPLPEAEIVSKFITENSAPDARLAILGSEPEIYFLAHRHSATGHIYTYPLMEPQPFALEMQHKMIAGIEAARPPFIVFADNIMSWNRRPDSDLTIFNWWENYKTNYTLVGMTDIVSPTNTLVVLGTNFIAHYPEAHGSALEIFQRK
jgi:Dolichyl-phosphate-mannose-protein mannosyltransferase